MKYSKRAFDTIKILAPITLAMADFLQLAPAADDPSAEWTLEQARKCWKPMTRAVQHVGVPGYEFQTGVMWDGALVFGPRSRPPVAAGRRNDDPVCAADGSRTRLDEARLDLHRL
jgi:hypothetical protein